MVSNIWRLQCKSDQTIFFLCVSKLSGLSAILSAKTFTENFDSKHHLLDLSWWYGLKNIFFRNKTFLFFKIESWNFQVQFEIKIRETSQTFNSFSFFRQLLFSSFSYWLSDWAEILQGFMKFNFKMNLKVSAFYLEKQKSFTSKKNFF